MPRQYPPYKGERIIGYDPSGAYVTASGRNIPEREYNTAVRGQKGWQQPSFTGKVSQPKPKPPGAVKRKPTPYDVPVYDTSETGLANRHSRMTKMDAEAQQQWLRSVGYDVTVDGIAGRQTKMARKAFLNGVPPSYWNKVWKRNNATRTTAPVSTAGPSPTAPPTADPGASGPAAPPVSTAPPGALVGTRAATASQGPAPSAPAVPAAPTAPVLEGFPVLNPVAYARGAANAEYNPQIQGFLDAIEYNRRAGREAQTDVRNWGNQVRDTFNRYGQLTSDAYQQAAEGVGQGAAQVGQLFGGDLAAEVAAYAQPGQDLIRTLAAGDKSFQDTMQGVFEQANIDNALRARREFDNNIAQAQSGLTQARTAKGQAYSKYLFEGQQAKQQALIAKENAKTAAQALHAAQALLPSQVKTAQAEADRAVADAKKAGIEAGAAKGRAQLEKTLTGLQIKQAEAALAKELKKTPEGVNLSDPQTVTNLSRGLLQGVIGAKGGLVLRPDIAWNNIQGILKNYTFSDPKLAQDIAKRAMSASLSVSHSKGQWKRWVWSKDGTRLVLKPAPKKTTTKK